MRIALAQMAMSGDKQGNLMKSLTMLEKAAERKADLILYPEVQLSPFFAQFPGNVGGCCGGAMGPEAIGANDPVFRMFREFCRKYRIMASPNFYYRENGKNYDASFLIARNGDLLGCQKMVHVAQMPQFYEQDYYTPSDDGFHVFDTEFGKIGIVVCFDRHFPESVRTEAVRGAELVLIPTANTAAEPMELFEQEVRVEAYQNSCFIAMANRTGVEAAMEFAGQSIAVNPEGDTIAKSNQDEDLLLVDIDLGEVKKAREKRPYFPLRRKEWYA